MNLTLFMMKMTLVIDLSKTQMSQFLKLFKLIDFETHRVVQQPTS